MEDSVEELIEALERTVGLWDKIQEKKAVLEAELIIQRSREDGTK